MINKIVQSMAEAMAGIADGATVLAGGFGSVGHPYALIEGLIEQGARELTIVANNAGWELGNRACPKLLPASGGCARSSAPSRAAPIR